MPCRCFLLLLFCFLPLLAGGQPRGDVYPLKKDSLYRIIGGAHWRFSDAEIKDGADTSLDDTQWPLVKSDLRKRGLPKGVSFKGTGWLRLHFSIDSAVGSRPLAIRMSQLGASEIYLDGKLITRYGELSPKDSVEYVNPQELPLLLPTISPGNHLLAVRYVNWLHEYNDTHYNEDFPGFNLSIWGAESALYSFSSQRNAVLFAFVMLFGIFITLALTHLILYLYYRAETANIRFSLLAAFISLLFLLPAIGRVTEDAPFLLNVYNAELYVVIGVAYSLSLLLNGLFSQRKWHHYIVVLACVTAIAFIIFWRQRVPYAFLALFILAPLEAIYILVSALLRRQPGARIIGGGLLLFIILLVVVMGTVLVQGDFYFSDNSLSGKIFLLVLVLAILSIPISMSMYLAWRFSRVNRDLKAQLTQVENLSEKAREQEAEKQRLLESRQEELEREVADRTANLRAEKQKSDDLLLNILPAEIAEELKETGRSEARLYNDVSVLFTDFVNFTQMSESLSPAALVAEIDECFKAFDHIIETHGLEKIKTVGDAYIAVCGMPIEDVDHASNVVNAALEIRAFMKARSTTHSTAFGIRLGVHSGPVVAGIVGVKKFAYDIWGDTVNTAARMEQHSEPDEINISSATYDLIKDRFVCAYRGELEAKHKGKMGMYFVESSAAVAAA